jgi:hypothetical protein
MSGKRKPFRVIRVFDYPRWPRSTFPRIIGIVLYYSELVIIPTESVNGSDGSENPRVPSALIAATRNWYQWPGRREFFKVTLVRDDRCRGTQLPRRAAAKWRPTWCLSSRRNRTGLSGRDACWVPANHSTIAARPLRLSVTDTLIGTGGRPVIQHRCFNYTRYIA